MYILRSVEQNGSHYVEFTGVGKECVCCVYACKYMYFIMKEVYVGRLKVLGIRSSVFMARIQV